MNSPGFLPPSDCPIFSEDDKKALDLLREGMPLAAAAQECGLKTGSLIKKLPLLRDKYRDYQRQGIVTPGRKAR